VRLREIDIDNFGLFSDVQLDFGDGGFRLVAGANEAGKSTLLQLIRELLFGFPTRNRYALATHQGEMAATARIELADGRCVGFRRRKGRKKLVVGQIEESGEAVDDSMLAQLLGNASGELYSHIFGFSLDELAAGEKSLERANLNEALYGSSIGSLASFQTVQRMLREESEALFAPRGSTRTINRLARDIGQATADLKRAAIRPADYQEFVQRHAEAGQDVQRARQQRDECQRRKAHLDRLTAALDPWLRLQDASAELDGIEPIDHFPHDGQERFRGALERLNAIDGDLIEAKEELSEAEAALSTLHLDAEIPAAEGTIKQLLQELGRIRDCRRDVPLRSQEGATLRNQVVAKLQHLNPDWDLADLDRFRTNLAQRDAVEQLSEAVRGIEEQQKLLRQRHDEAARRAEAAEQALAALHGVTAPPQLEQWLPQAGRYQADREKLAEDEATIAALDVEVDGLRQQLSGSLGVSGAGLEQLPIPLEATVTQFARRFAQCQQGVAEAVARRDDAKDQLAALEDDLSRLESAEAVPDRETLIATRRHRDAGWQLIRRRYIDAQDTALDGPVADWLDDPEVPLPDAYEQGVTAADQLADRRQAKAQLVAEREQLASAIARQQARVTQLTEAVAERESQRDTCTAQWHTLWRPCGITPQSPEAMQQWLRLHGELGTKLQQRQVCGDRAAKVRASLERFTAALHEALHDDHLPAEHLAEIAQQRVSEAREAAAERRRYEQEMAEQTETLTTLDQQLHDIDQQRQQSADRWQKLLGELGFPPHWEVRSVRTILAELASAQQDFQQVGLLQQRVRAMQSELVTFETKVAELCQTVAADLNHLPAEDTVTALAERLEAAQQAAHQQTTLAAQRAKTKGRIELKTTQRQETEAALDALRRMVGANSDQQFFEIAQQVQRRKSLSEETERLHKEIKRSAATEYGEPFCDELACADADRLEADRRRADETLTEAEAALEEAVRSVALAKNKLDQLGTAGEANQAALQLESLRAELRAAVDRWAPLALGQTLMNEAITRFERAHQPTLLRDVEDLFRRMTADRYVAIHRKLDEQGTLVVAQRDGQRKEPSQLSRGTREQLYLAMRLAYILHYCRENEPLPVVMDDVLVNFDDQRAESTLQLLVDVAQTVQIIFLTCHDDTAQRVRRATAGQEPIVLG
jgi:uncharacterized protein YhaN